MNQNTFQFDHNGMNISPMMNRQEPMFFQPDFTQNCMPIEVLNNPVVQFEIQLAKMYDAAFQYQRMCNEMNAGIFPPGQGSFSERPTATGSLPTQTHHGHSFMSHSNERERHQMPSNRQYSQPAPSKKKEVPKLIPQKKCLRCRALIKTSSINEIRSLCRNCNSKIEM